MKSTRQLKVSAELHIHAESGHGFGLRANDPKPAANWIERFEEWLANSGFLKGHEPIMVFQFGIPAGRHLLPFIRSSKPLS